MDVPKRIQHLITADPEILERLHNADEAHFKEIFSDEEKKYPELAEAEQNYNDAFEHLLLWQQIYLNFLNDAGLEVSLKEQ